VTHKTLGIGDRYQQETKYSREHMGRGFLDWEHKPKPFKEYPDAVPVIKLLPPQKQKDAGFWHTLTKRRSRRDFTAAPLSLEELSQLVFATQGITAHYEGYLFRTTPSAGALYPVESYLAVNRVATIPRGLYHFNVEKNSLELLRDDDTADGLCRAALGQTMVIDSAVVFIWTALVARAKWKYGERAYRYIYMDAGHIGQNLYLAAAALNLGCCTIGAFFDDEVNNIIGVDGIEETAVYMGVVGKCY
jgi:SagB-type dehydrogenase family enzyme